MTVYDDNGSFELRLEGKDMFVPGTQIDANDASIADWCFVPLLKHDQGPENTWFLGTPILSDYYTVFDMTQASGL